MEALLSLSDRVVAPSVGEYLDPKSEKFKEWFADSKVCLRAGRPMTLFRGITRTLEARHPSAALGVFLTPDKAVASAYAGNAGKLLGFYVCIKRPFITDMSVLQDISTLNEASALKAKLIRSGYDGIFARHKDSDQPPSYVSEYIAFHLNQLRPFQETQARIG